MILIIVLIIGSIGLDQLTKLLSVRLLKPLGSVPIIKGVLHLTYLENEGAAFGMLSDHRWVFMTVSTVAILLMAGYLYMGYSQNKLYGISLSLIVSGGIGNMIDRIALGYVVDFIDFCLIDFAIFNGADSFVCIGAGMLILALVLDVIKEARNVKK
jgi:signal peptidase II